MNSPATSTHHNVGTHGSANGTKLPTFASVAPTKKTRHSVLRSQEVEITPMNLRSLAISMSPIVIDDEREDEGRASSPSELRDNKDDEICVLSVTDGCETPPQPTWRGGANALNTPHRREIIDVDNEENQMTARDTRIGAHNTPRHQEVIDVDKEEDRSDDDDDDATTEEDAAARARREEEESLALARALMAEEAMAVSYHMSMDYLQHNRDQFSEEDLVALQAAMDDEDEPQLMPQAPVIDEADLPINDASMSYEMMLRLGDQLGDVKSERWAMVARQKINELPIKRFCAEEVKGVDENDCCKKCLVCQFLYKEGEQLRELPCKHRFHTDCIDQWLLTKNFCPYCRQCIVEE